MRRIDNYQNTREILFHIDVPFITPPRIARTKIIEGEVFYVGTNKKLYRADLYDKMFTTTTATAVKPYNFKGTKCDEAFSLFSDEEATVDSFNKQRRKKANTNTKEKPNGKMHAPNIKAKKKKMVAVQGNAKPHKASAANNKAAKRKTKSITAGRKRV